MYPITRIYMNYSPREPYTRIIIFYIANLSSLNLKINCYINNFIISTCVLFIYFFGETGLGNIVFVKAQNMAEVGSGLGGQWHMST